LALQVDGQAIRPSPLVTVPVPAPLVVTARANFWVKVAVAFTADAGMLNEQEPVPLQVPPLQPENTNPEAGVAVITTAEPELKLEEQVPELQLIPAGLLATVPDPAIVTLTGKGAGAKFAFTDSAGFVPSKVMEQAPVPEQAPLQPVKTDPALALSVTVTVVGLVTYVLLHVVAQFVIFPSVVLIVPVPVLPLVLTVNVRFGEKVAPTFTAEVLTVKLQVPVPEQAPVQPAKVDPEAV
jgi:hypothetical protein